MAPHDRANDDRSLIPASIARYLVMTLIGVYWAIGTPGPHTQIAKAPLEVTSGR